MEPEGLLPCSQQLVNVLSQMNPLGITGSVGLSIARSSKQLEHTVFASYLEFRVMDRSSDVHHCQNPLDSAR
jgi:hypothetical protein